MASYIEKAKNYFTDDRNLNNRLKKVVFNLRYTQQKIYPVFNFENANKFKVETLLPKDKAKNYLPKIFGVEQKYESTASPEIGLFVFKNAIININSSAILKNKKLYIDFCENERFNEGYIQTHSKTNGKVSISNPICIEEGFFLGGNGAWNWYHFMVEIIPKILLLPPNLTKILLVSEVVMEFPSMQRILEIVVPNYEIMYLKQNQCYRVKKLIHINDFNHIPFNNLKGNDIDTANGYFNNEIIKDFSDRVLARIQQKEQELPKRFYLERTTHRIASNEAELKQLLGTFRIEPINLMTLTLDQQVQLFKKAEFIVGISGAGWTNLMFCRNNPTAICLVPDIAKSSTVFANIAENADVNLLNLFYHITGSHYENGFNIPLANLENLLKTFLNEK